MAIIAQSSVAGNLRTAAGDEIVSSTPPTASRIGPGRWLLLAGSDRGQHLLAKDTNCRARAIALAPPSLTERASGTPTERQGQASCLREYEAL